MATTAQAPEEYEELHVHGVYEQIASHFSSTRYKPWPIVAEFLQSMPPGSVGLDVGCGNGKYLAVNRDIFIIGSDRSSNLVKIASQHQPHAAVVADSLSLPHQGKDSHGRGFDFAISIAVVHHLSTQERRQEAIRSLLECLREGGKALIYVWALEQKGSRRGWDEGHEQDVMVPWVMKTGRQQIENGMVSEPEETTFQRYYHLYRSGELEEDIQAAGGGILQSGYEKDNWWAIATAKEVDGVVRGAFGGISAAPSQ
jgi:tRNA (uracil-5-)-methyltransferase TRM9